MNPQWKFRPTIYFIDGTTNVLKYKYHGGGDAHMMIYECCGKNHLPSDKPDQILQVVTKIRTIRKGKLSLYYTE